MTGVALMASESRAEEPADLVLAQLGAPYYQRYCASCHGLEGTGNGPVASALSTPPADLTRIAQRRGGVLPAGEIAMYIDGRYDVTAHGPAEMPVWGARFGEPVPDASVGDAIARGKIAVIVEYLKSIQVPGTSSGPGD